MIEIKVQCECGQRYKFDVEPLNGEMPFAVNCPACGADGTPKANEILAQFPARPAARVTSSPMRIAVAPVAQPTAAPAAGPVASAVPPPTAPRATPFPAQPPTAPVDSRPKPAQQFLLGAVGAVVFGTLAMIAWFLLIKLTGYEIGFAAWGVGLLTGFGARLLGKAGSTALGLTAGTCAFLAIVGGQFLYAKSEVDKVIDEAAAEAYTERMEYAREAVKVQTDDEVKLVLAKYEDNNEPTAEEIKTFRTEELPKLKDLASGKTTQVQFEKEIKGIKDTFVYQLGLLKETVGLFTLLWLFLGVSSAYKLGAS
jgi:hypothetical protein